MEEVIVIEYGRKRKKIKDVCLHCKKTFLRRINAKRIQKYCSQGCSSKAKSLDNSEEVICTFCNVSFSKKKSALEGSKSGLYFCTREHKDLAQRLGGIEEIQPPHYGTASHERDYRKIAFDNKENKCNACGYDKYKRVLIVHHIDRDRTNSSIDNLEILCPTCHAEEHFLAKDGLWTNFKG